MGALSDLIFGIREIFFGSAMPLRGTVEFTGSSVVVTDDEVNDRTVVAISDPTGINGASGVATINAHTVAGPLDDYAAMRTIVGNAYTTNDTPLATVLYTAAGNDVLEVSATIIVRDELATQRGRVRVSGLAYREAGTLAWEAAPSPVADVSDPGLAATLSIAGDAIRVVVTGLAGTDLRWGWEVRTRRVIF